MYQVSTFALKLNRCRWGVGLLGWCLAIALTACAPSANPPISEEDLKPPEAIPSPSESPSAAPSPAPTDSPSPTDTPSSMDTPSLSPSP